MFKLFTLFKNYRSFFVILGNVSTVFRNSTLLSLGIFNTLIFCILGSTYSIFLANIKVNNFIVFIGISALLFLSWFIPRLFKRFYTQDTQMNPTVLAFGKIVGNIMNLIFTLSSSGQMIYTLLKDPNIYNGQKGELFGFNILADFSLGEKQGWLNIIHEHLKGLPPDIWINITNGLDLTKINSFAELHSYLSSKVLLNLAQAQTELINSQTLYTKHPYIIGIGFTAIASTFAYYGWKFMIIERLLKSFKTNSDDNSSLLRSNIEDLEKTNIALTTLNNDVKTMATTLSVVDPDNVEKLELIAISASDASKKALEAILKLQAQQTIRMNHLSFFEFWNVHRMNYLYTHVAWLQSICMSDVGKKTILSGFGAFQKESEIIMRGHCAHSAYKDLAAAANEYNRILQQTVEGEVPRRQLNNIIAHANDIIIP